jgi:nanoRNase/pAp phosphatase (c-di-AMP/oligoRNAs hydrolase)
MMSVMLEGNLDHHPIGIDWDATHADESVNTAQEQLVELIESIGGPSWANAIREL